MLTLALAEPPSSPVVAPVTLAEAIAESDALADEADRGEFTPWGLARALALAAEFPGSERLQFNVGRLVGITGDEQAARACWRNLLSRFPQSTSILPRYAASLARHLGPERARTVVDAYLPPPDRIDAPRDALRAARSLAALGDESAAAAILARFDEAGDAPGELRVELARLLENRGDYDGALSVLRRAGEHRRASAEARRIEEARSLFGSMRGVSGPPGLVALDALLAHACDWRERHPPSRPHAALGPIALIGGTLGGGGAERQLVNTALGLQERGRTGGFPVGPVAVYCRKLDTRRANDFHLPRLDAAGIRVADYLRAEPLGGDPRRSRLAPLLPMIELLPPRMREGARQLTELLRHEAPDTVQIWQDGMIFAAGLAALIANVPRIVLNVRTMPPSTRTDRAKPEQRVLYRGLLAARGVILTANSRMAARAYEEWLGLPAGAVPVVPNGVAPLAVEAPAAEEARWQAFDRRTGCAGFVFGGVMRLDDNKRPLEWLGIAAALAARLPDARFVLAGAGPLRAAAEEFARRKEIAERTLFIGQTGHVGHWLSRMDALGLTSRHEGTPNVLIEAQLAGVPVLTTPAGGAPEATAAHPANCVLDSAETIDARAAAAHLKHLAARTPERTRADAEALRGWASERYAPEAMIEHTLDIFMSPDAPPLVAAR